MLSQMPSYDREIIFVNDGSQDATREVIKQLSETNPAVHGINFSANFGKEIALSAGVQHAKGDAVITLDADWQHDISKLPLFLQHWEEGYDVVYNKRPITSGASFSKRISSNMFYRIFNSISEFQMEAHTTDYRLIDRKVANIFAEFTEKNRIYRWLIDRIWFNSKEVVFDALPPINDRKASYTYTKLFKLALDSLTSFSVKPLKLVGYIGFFFCFWSFAGLIRIIIDRITGGGTFTNLWLFMLLNTFLIGIVMIALGMMAIYIANIHEEVRQRPLYIIKDKTI